MEKYVAKTFQGLETVLEQELKQLGIESTKKLSRAVAFEGTTEQLYKANLHLRTALRILHPVAVDTARNQKQLYDLAHSINWLRWFGVNQTFSIQARAFKNREFTNSTFVALKVKDAICDQFRRLRGSRPSVDKNNPDILIDVHIFKDICTISIDSSGESLHRRGYRDSGHRAPMNEVLAAGMVLLSEWDINTPFIDPFCGSGTILTEAAMYACNKAPNIKRTAFGFSHWKNFDNKLWDKVWLNARATERSYDGTIIGSDISKKIIMHARQQVAKAGVDDCIRLSAKSFEERSVPEGPGTVLTNPPYGERLSFYEIESMYKAFGDKLKNDYAGYNAWIISSVEKFNRFIGLAPSKKIQLYNGKLDCRLMKFEMYSGTKRKDK